jgi:hypothetical protein
MAITLIGEIVSDCDTANFAVGSAGNMSDDDDFVEGTGAIGFKCSNATQILATTTLGAGAPYDFASGPETGNHIIMWFNSKTPLELAEGTATPLSSSGVRCYIGDGTNAGEWNVYPRGFYKGGFTLMTVDTARDFDNISAGTWTLTGNPTQLTSITEMGGTFTTTTSIMGNFNNCQLDQITIGSGLRVDAGTVGSPNTFETVRAADEDTNFFGWWTSVQGAVVGRGKLYIGPSDEATTSVFNDSAFAVIFADENIASGFYSFEMVGTGTDVTWDLANISSADVTTNPNGRWAINTATDLKSFSDTNGTWQNFDYITLGTGCTLTGTSLIDGRTITQNSGLLDGCSVIEADRGDGESFLLSDYPDRIQNCTFTQSSGHAIELTSLAAGKSITFQNNEFIGYEGTAGTNDTANSGPTNAAIYNNSGGAVTLNLTGANPTNPVIRNGVGATTTVVNAKTLTLNGIVTNSEVRVFALNTTTELDGVENVAETGNGLGSFTYSFEGGDPNVDIRIFNTNYRPADLLDFELGNSDKSQTIQQIFDRNYENP